MSAASGALISSVTNAYLRACVLHGCEVDYRWLTEKLLIDYDLDSLNVELRNFNEYWSDIPKGKRHKSVKRTIRNWMSRAAPAVVQSPGPSRKARSQVGHLLLSDPPGAERKWMAWIRAVSAHIDPHTHRAWYRSSRGIGYDASGATLVVETSNEIARAWLADAELQPDFDVRYQARDVSDHRSTAAGARPEARAGAGEYSRDRRGQG